MVGILLLKFTKNLTGITFSKMESRSETFADDTTIILQRSAKNLTFADFHIVSGLSCNIEKTSIIPFGMNTNHKDTLCDNLGFEWTNNFTLLGFCLDNTLTKLHLNFTKVKEK